MSPRRPQRPLRLPHIVAAHERHYSNLIMKAMTHKAIYAQTPEGYTPAWTELVEPRSVWTAFIESVRAFIQRAMSKFQTDRGDVVRRALEENGPRIQFCKGPVWVCDQNHSRYEHIAQLSSRSALSAAWTVAAREAHR
ncbi:hypothetical protein ACGC1H_006101 [Rhizoctonia solani]